MNKRNRVILVMADAVGYQAASDRCGYLGNLVERGLAAKYKVKGELPALSKPMYETIMTGLTPAAHGVTTCEYRGGSTSPNLFSLTRQYNRKNAAAAYGWICELYNGTEVFNKFTDRFRLNNRNGDIDQGIFYMDDFYPDSHVYADADYLLRAFSPDFLLVHPMGADTQGHLHGASSLAYQCSVENSINCLSYYLPFWLGEGYSVLFTADHGMDDLGTHFGDTEQQRNVPLYIVSDAVEKGNFSDHDISQLNIAPLVCSILGIPRAEGMLDPSKEIRGLTV
jgi:predicted AlkP superfamily pyrophosphatase or phosphodiesterase